MMRAKQNSYRVLALFLVFGTLGQQAPGQQVPSPPASGPQAARSASTLVEPVVRVNHEENSKHTPQLASRVNTTAETTMSV